MKDEYSINRLQYLWLGEEQGRPEIHLFGNLVQEIKILGIYFSLDVKAKENLTNLGK